MSVPARVGVLALQGGVREHVRLLEHLGAGVSEIRSPADLVGPDGLRVDALVLPGGESSTMSRLLGLFDLFEPLTAAVRTGVPTLGTCAGLVLLAEEVLDPAPDQRSIGGLAVTVRRNALGPQVDSAETILDTSLGLVRAAFIRAPIVTAFSEDVTALARHAGQVVAVSQGAVTGIAFHPELTGDDTFHRDLLHRATSAEGRARQTQPAHVAEG